jgi:hypothetical protein
MTYEERMIDAAKRYADADKSDPFTFARCMTHIRQGLCTICEGESNAGCDGHYDAEAGVETHVTADGNEYLAVVYRNISRT